ncbi:GIP [Symbiodinium sp. CCMP2592]|nr:GIP [Symbiodinium sp. CCMP2592]
MDPLSRRRRASGAGEPDDGMSEEEYRAALSQGGPAAGPVRGTGGVSLNGILPGEASPGTLESGEAKMQVAGEPATTSAVDEHLPVANPFHSEKVRTEVELIRNRPTSLDDDGRRLRVDPDAPTLGETRPGDDGEPNYAAALGGGEGSREAPRVARVDVTAGSPRATGNLAATFPGGAPQETSLSAPPRVYKAEESAGDELGPDPFGPEDARELIPASDSDRLGRLESLLVQVVAENKSLKRRLEIESRSHSSWHSGIAAPEWGSGAVPESFSPATFGPRSGSAVQAFLASDFPGHEGRGLGGCNVGPTPVTDIDVSWLRSALVSASDPSFALIDSGDWGRYRDEEFTKLEIVSEGVTYRLTQMKSDDALWLARTFKDGSLGDTAGILVVYVDDLAFFGPADLCSQFILAIKARWKTSDPEWICERPVTFCGIELSRGEAGYRMTQRAYIQELLNRYEITTEASVPINKWTEPEGADSPTVDQIREAQAVTGALLWLSTRTRPDIAYVVARCGQQATKSPLLSIAMGRQALEYLKSTIDMGIDVPFQLGDTFSNHELLALPRTDRVLELYTDASHSPGGDRSMQSIFIVWRSVPLAWEVTRQAFTTLSSAESELVTMVVGIQRGEAIQPLIEEVVEADSVLLLYADNEAALRSFELSPSGWRSRHLRMRASAARERISANLLRVSHMPGEQLIADLGLVLLAMLPRVKGQPFEDRLLRQLRDTGLYAGEFPGQAEVTLALSIWLRRVYQLRMAQSQLTYDAANAYLQSGTVQYPFEPDVERDQPADASDFEDDEEIDESSAVVAPTGPVYEAVEGALLCTYADDTVVAGSLDETWGPQHDQCSAVSMHLVAVSGPDAPDVDLAYAIGHTSFIPSGGPGILLMHMGDVSEESSSE